MNRRGFFRFLPAGLFGAAAAVTAAKAAEEKELPVVAKPAPPCDCDIKPPVEWVITLNGMPTSCGTFTAKNCYFVNPPG